MATHSSLLAWEIPWTEEPGRLCLWDPEEWDMTEQLTHTHKTSQLEYLTILVYPKLRGVLGCGPFSATVGTVLGKLRRRDQAYSPRASKQKRNVICRVPVPELCSRVDLELRDSE